MTKLWGSEGEETIRFNRSTSKKSRYFHEAISFIIERSKLRFILACNKVEARRSEFSRARRGGGGGVQCSMGPGTNAVIRPGPMIRSQELSVTNVQSAASSTAEIAPSEVTVTLITSFQFVSGAQPRYVTGIRPFCRAKN